MEIQRLDLFLNFNLLIYAIIYEQELKKAKNRNDK